VSSRPPSATRPSGRSWSGPGLFRAQARSVKRGTWKLYCAARSGHRLRNLR